MNSWRETINLPQPLYDVRLSGSPRPAPVATADPRIEQEAYAHGRAEGEAAARTEFERQKAEFAALQNGILSSLKNSVGQVARECEGTLVALALEVARKMVAGLPINQSQVEASVREALEEVENKTAVRVQLHAEDLALLQDADSPLLRPASGSEQVTFEVSDTVSRGGCMVQTSFGTIDGRRETKFEVLRDTLLT